MQEEPTMVQETCSQCGRLVRGDEPHGLCPSCLLRRAALEETVERPERECAACGNTLAEGARFCASCGVPAPVAAEASADPLRHALEAKLGAQYRVLRLL